MCGFAGIVNLNRDEGVDISVLKAMNQTMVHRGPDDEGYFCKGNVGIAHRRLSIIDVSSAGRQPIYNENNTILVVLNGEIYNFKNLKEELSEQGHIFKTRTDTEVIVHSYERWGIDFLNRLDGMFSLALFDIPNSKLILAKDLFGKKPLYYTLQNGVFLFASELKAFFPHNHFSKQLDLNSISKYLAYDYVPTPHTIFENCKKLTAASYLEINTSSLSYLPAPNRYLELRYEPKLKISQEEAINELHSLLKQSVSKRTISDVPLGLFLSGGIDSSSIVAMMSEFMPSQEIRTFNIGFYEKSYDESFYASKVAKYFGTRHYEEMFYTDRMIDFIPKVIGTMDEPFADASIFPTYLLCKFARNYVTVALSGDGGDELFAGYDTFLVPHNISRLIERLPLFMLNSSRKVASYLPLSDKNMSYNFRIKHFLKGFNSYTRSNLELRNSVWIGSFHPDLLKRLFKSSVETDTEYASIYSETLFHKDQRRALRLTDRSIDNFINLYLHDDILVKADRASMMNSLELRAPFLDKTLAAFVNRLPADMKLKGFNRKYLLKKAMQRVLPEDVLNRPKKGFGIPVAKWLRSSLRPMILDIFSAHNLSQHPFFNKRFVENLLDEHQNRKKDHRKEIWTLLIFELWRQHHKL